MPYYTLYPKGSTKQERQTGLLKSPIPIEKWKSYVGNHPAFTWFIHTELGKINISHPTAALAPELHYCKAILDYNPATENNEFHYYLDGYIRIHLWRTTIRRLEIMWQVAQDLDVDLCIGSTTIDHKRFMQILERYRPKDKKKKKE